MTETLNRSGLAPYLEALTAGDKVAIRRILADADGYMQTLVTNASNYAAQALAQAQASAASAAASSASAANASASEAATQVLYNKVNALLVSFSRVWYGTLPSDPTTDPNGNPPITGAGYFNSTEDKIRIWNGTKWEDYDDEAEQLTQQAAVSAAYAAQSATAASTSAANAAASANTAATYANQIVPIFNQLNALFPPLTAGCVPQVNAQGTAYQMVNLANIFVPLAGNCTIAGQVTFSSNITVGGIVYGRATSSLYGDLAERYLTRHKYKPGTLISLKTRNSKPIKKAFEAEASVIGSPFIGVISTRPGLIINGKLVNGQQVGVIGRVPTRVLGAVQYGDPITLSDTPGVGRVGSGPIIGYALEESDDVTEKLIEVSLCGGAR